MRFEVTDKINSVVIPSTINDVLMARIDRLEDKTRELVKVASVIGRSFFDRVIKDVASSIEGVDHRLAYLKDVQLIRETMRMEELEYLFKHALAQEAAYESTLLQQRKVLHLKVAQSIEKLFRERLPEFYGMLAYHYSKAEDPERAEYWMTKAGEEALRTSASSEALHYYKEALRLYLDKYADSADPEKLAAFEKNIAMAYFNKAQWKNALPYFEKVFSRWGRRPPKNQLSIMAKLAYDMLIIMLRLYLPFSGPKKIPDQRVNEFFDLALKKDIVLMHSNPTRGFTEGMGDARESLKYDLTKMNIAAAVQLHAGGAWSLCGFFGMGELLLDHAKKLVDAKNIGDAVCYKWNNDMHNYMAGKWTEIPEYDKLLFDACTKNGCFWDINAYSIWQAAVKIYQGKFLQAPKVLENFSLLEEKYGNGVSSSRILRTEFLVAHRQLHLAQTEANHAISFSVERGTEPYELQGIGWRAVVQVLLKDISGANDSLTYAEHIIRKQNFWPPWHLASSLLAQFDA